MADSWTTCLSRRRIFAAMRFIVAILALFFIACNGSDTENGSDTQTSSLPTVFVAILVRNKAHTLPWFFGHLENLNYPKDRIALWYTHKILSSILPTVHIHIGTLFAKFTETVPSSHMHRPFFAENKPAMDAYTAYFPSTDEKRIRSDHNVDNSTAIIQKWIKETEHLYNSVEFVYSDKPNGYEGEIGPCHWTLARFDHVIQLREKAIEAARLMWADYIFMIDADVMVENPDTLQILVDQKKTIIAPKMNASVGETYSNYWAGMDESGYYKRVPEYFEILSREIEGAFEVPMVHTVFLMNLKHKQSEKLSYIPPPGYTGPEDDIIIFALSAKDAGVPMYVLNTDYFGHVMVPLEEHHNLFIEDEQFTYLRVEALDADNPEMGPGVDYIIEGRGLLPSPHVDVPLKKKDYLGFDKVYMINLDRRSERRKRMLHVFDILGIEAELIPAVDGKRLNDTYLYQDLKIEVVPGFTDPYGGRPMTMGEIGCFLSHYFIWKDMVEKGYKEVVVFEDDLRFEPYFRTKLATIMSLVARKVPNWDLIYLGRKRLNRKDEVYLEGTESLVWPSYSYWTLSYLLSSRGARKLLAQKPLQNLLPVDEYLPVMFDKHPEDSWKEPFYPRDLVALSAEPLLIYPTHYLGEAHYISDTEWSELITEKTDHNRAEVPQDSPIPGYAGNEPKGDQFNPSSTRRQDEL